MDLPIFNVVRATLAPTLSMIRQLSSQGGLYRQLRAGFRASAILLNVPGHLRLLRVMSHPHIIGLASRRPKIVYKYLSKTYLVECFSRNTRLNILTYHYSYLKDRVNVDFHAQIFDGKYTLWQQRLAENSYSISMTFPHREHDFEGDILLVFESDSAPIYSITFTIAAGPSVNVGSERVLLVTAVQGTAGKIDAIRQATRVCNDTPAHLLLAAAEAIARSLDIGMLAGIGLEQQVQKQVGENPQFKFDYDDFWQPIAGEKTNGIFYLLPIPFPQKPIQLVKSKYRSREVRRRELKKEISERVRLSFEQKCLTSVITTPSSPDD